MSDTEKRLFTTKDVLALDSGLYGGINEDGETVLVGRDKGNGYSVRTFQKNGWHRINYYDEEGFPEGERFESGRDPDLAPGALAERITVDRASKARG